MSLPVTPGDTIAELLAGCPGAARVLVDRGMHCVGCAIARFETIGEACAIYGVSVEDLLIALDGQGRAEAGRPGAHDQRAAQRSA